MRELRPIRRGMGRMDENERVVDCGVSRFGLHRLHVIRLGEAVDIERWIEERVPPGGTVETYLRYEEKELGVHHLRLYWIDGEITSDDRNDSEDGGRSEIEVQDE